MGFGKFERIWLREESDIPLDVIFYFILVSGLLFSRVLCQKIGLEIYLAVWA